MTRKLAVTVFAMSLTLVGCGSSSTTKPDAAADGKMMADTMPVMPDTATAPTPDGPMIADVAVDNPVATPDGPVADMPVVVPDGGMLPDTKPATDVPAPKLDALDAPGADVPAHEVGTVDGGDAGQED
jgi:hypothetical protein